jgi:hypothetical protein
VLISRVADPDPHYFWKLDPDPGIREKICIGIRIKVKSQKPRKAVDAHSGGLEAQNREAEDF